jgi:hypothetical protein
VPGHVAEEAIRDIGPWIVTPRSSSASADVTYGVFIIDLI